MRISWAKLPIIISIGALSACANLNTVHRKLDLGDESAKAVAIDGYQLPIFSMRATGTADGKLFDKDGKRTVFVVCPNPPVEAITAGTTNAALTNAFKGAASAGAIQTPGVSNDTQAAIASAMAAASIGLRTNSTTLLSYNATANCLAYMGGATQDRKFMELARRNQDITLAILAIEQLTGVAQAGQASLNVGGSAGTGATNTQSLQTAIDSARKDQDVARSTLATKDEEVIQAQQVLQEKIATQAKARKDSLAIRDPKLDPKPTEQAISDADTALASASKDVESARKEVTAKQISQYSARLDLARLTDSVEHAQTALELAERNVRAQASGSALVGDGSAGRASTATEKVAQAVVDIVTITTASINTGEGCASIFDDFINSNGSAGSKYDRDPGKSLMSYCLKEKRVETEKAISKLPPKAQERLNLN
jgi:hypothetical protein